MSDKTIHNMTQQTMALNYASKHQKASIGSALIAIIASILLFSVLSATLLPMVSSSGTQVAFTHLADSAYALAESGYRLVESRYRNAASEALGYAELDALEDANFTMDDNGGALHLNIYSYFFRITAINGTSQFTADPPGALALDTTITGYDGSMQIRGQLYTIDSVTTNGDGGNFTFTVSGSLDPEITTGDIVYPATKPVSDGTLSFIDGFAQSLPYTANEGDLFPLRNGTIKLGPHYLKYRYNDRSSNLFTDLNDPDAPANGNFTYTYSAEDKIVLTNFTIVHSTGKVGGGSFVAEREVVYYDALPRSGSALTKYSVEDRFDDPEQKWNPQEAINSTDPDGDGNTAATITENESSTSGLATLKPDETQEAFDRLRRINGGYLGYDAQIKVGFTTEASTEQPIPFAVAAGLSFRLSEVSEGSTTEYNGYGLSFVRGDINATEEGVGSGLFDEIIPEGQANRSLIVLWQQTLDGSDVERDWLAYKVLNPLYQENFNTGDGSWNKIPSDEDNPWERRSDIGNGTDKGSWVFRGNNLLGAGLEGAIQYPGNETITDKWISLCEKSQQVTLQFYCNDHYANSDDIKLVKLRIEGDSDHDWNDFSQNTIEIAYTGSTGLSYDWQPVSISLDKYAGENVQLRFYFYRDTDPLSPYSSFYQWAIDDVTITCHQWPAQDSTLLVRLQEAAVVTFTDGGPLSIETGDWILGGETQSRATVVGTPILSGGNWTADDAEGTLLLNDIIDGAGGPGFKIGETLYVLNRSGGIQAKAAAYNDSDDRKVNIIKAYYGSADGWGTANDDSLDANMTAYGRLEENETLKWPPDEGDPWTAETDYFRLIQWDGINDSNASALNVAHIAWTETPEAEGKFAILRTHEEKLQSPATGDPSPSPEFGLHAYGDGAGRTYFDDFGFQLIFPPADVFAAPFQQ